MKGKGKHDMSLRFEISFYGENILKMFPVVSSTKCVSMKIKNIIALVFVSMQTFLLSKIKIVLTFCTSLFKVLYFSHFCFF